jgi:hypothetical protein
VPISESSRTVWGIVFGGLLTVVALVTGGYFTTHPSEWDWTSIPMIISYVLGFLAVVSLVGLVLGWPFPFLRGGEPVRPGPVGPAPVGPAPVPPVEVAQWVVNPTGIDFGAGDNTAKYRLVNKGDTSKYHVSVEGSVVPVGIIKSWEVIHGGISEAFDVPKGKNVDQQFTVRWHLTENKSDTVRTWKDKARPPYA